MTWADWSDERIGEIITDEITNPKRRELGNLISSFDVETVLDIGCGPGALWMHIAGKQITGIDSAFSMVKASRQQLLCYSRGGITAICGNATQLPLRTKTFDLAVLRHVLEHLNVPHCRRVLREVCRVAKRKAIINFYIPPKDNPFPRLSAERDAEGFLEVTWPPNWLRAQLSQHNWKVVGIIGGQDETWILEPAT